MESSDQQFEAFVLEHQDRVFGYAMRMLSNRAEAQDIAQETFLRAFRHFSSLRQEPAVRGWLKTVTRNLCLNHLTRSRSRWRFFSDWRKERAGEKAPDPVESIPSPVDDKSEAERSDERALLEKLLGQLPEQQRIPLILYHFDDMSYEEIAGMLKVSLGKVKTDIHRARHALKKKISKHQAARQEWGNAVDTDDFSPLQCQLYGAGGAIS
jgi:RNA polymerase sigma-70 factor (ECF subfamily)